MLKMNHILLPVDFSPRTRAAVKYATTLAARFHASVTVLQALAPMNVVLEAAGGGGGNLVREVLAHQKEEAEAKLQAFLAKDLGDFEARPVLVEGDPASAIVDFARSNKVDLIVTPTRGCGVFRRFLLGSVTAKVLHDASCPVLTTQHAEEVCSDGNWELSEVLCVVNLGSGDGDAIGWAQELASAFEARLSIAYAMPSMTMRPETYYLESDMGRLLAKDVRERIEKELSASGIMDANIYVQPGSAANVVRAIAEDHHANLVVIGRGSGNGNRSRLQTDSYAVIRESPCPVISI